MIRVNELHEFTDKDIAHELKEFLIRKFSDILKELNIPFESKDTEETGEGNGYS